MSNPTLTWSFFSELINARRFSLKFRQIVRNEAGDNFISKLHRGKLAIIPWPVIQSTRFYELFGALKTRLEKQPVTHKSAGEFLRVLKMLMAKLKVRRRTSCPAEVSSEILFRLAIGAL
jgi:hypothetical protein